MKNDAKQWYVRLENERQAGPFTGRDLKSLARSGRLAKSTMIRKDQSRWVQATSVRGLFASSVSTTVPEQPPESFSTETDAEEEFAPVEVVEHTSSLEAATADNRVETPGPSDSPRVASGKAHCGNPTADQPSLDSSRATQGDSMNDGLEFTAEATETTAPFFERASTKAKAATQQAVDNAKPFADQVTAKANEFLTPAKREQAAKHFESICDKLMAASDWLVAAASSFARKLGVWDSRDSGGDDNASQSVTLEGLSKISVNANWKLPPSRLPHLLVHDMGNNTEAITDAFIRQLNERKTPEMQVGLVAEMENEPGRTRPIRICHKYQPSHRSTTDVILQAKGDDLYTVFRSKPRTHLAYLDYGLRTLLLFVGVLTFTLIYLQATGARKSWIKDYADRHAALAYNDSSSAFMTKRLLHGGHDVDWVAFTAEVMDDPENSKFLYDSIDATLRDSYERGASAEIDGDSTRLFEDLATGMEMQRMRSWGRNIPQYWSTYWLEKAYGDSDTFAWHNGQGIVARIEMGGVSLPNATGAYEWTTIELTSIDPLHKLIEAEGGSVDHMFMEAMKKHTTTFKPWSIFRLCREDPRTALFNIGMPMSICSGLIGFVVWRLPRTWVRFPCRLLGWITPDDFNARAIASNAWVERQLSKTLTDFGVGRDQITELQGQAHHA